MKSFTRWYYCVVLAVVAAMIGVVTPLTAHAETSSHTQADTGHIVIGVLPDTQYYARFSGLFHTLYGSDPYMSQTQWIAQHHKDYGINFVTHLGDIVDRVDQDYEWRHADRAMKVLEDAHVPYSILAGNHDLGILIAGKGKGDTYLSWFPVERARKNSTFIERDPSRMHEAHLISVHGHKVLVIALSWNCDDKGIQWAQTLIHRYPGIPTIITSHRFHSSGIDGHSSVPTQFGEKIWQKLVYPNDQVFATIGGHFTGATRWERTNAAGHKVQQILMDYQFNYMGGNGYMGLLDLDFHHGHISLTTFSPWVMEKPASTLIANEKAYLDGDNQSWQVDEDFASRFHQDTGHGEEGTSPTDALRAWLRTFHPVEISGSEAPTQDLPL